MYRMPAPDRQVTLITRVNCHLCTEASAILRRLAGEYGYDYRERDVDTDPELSAAERDEFGDHVPVILIDGKEHGYWRVEEARFLKAILR
jgi:glutaredoxin